MSSNTRSVDRLRPIFVEVMPALDAIQPGEIWISHKHRTLNLRCPCGCGDLTVLSLHPSRWHVHFDGKAVSLAGPTGGSVWTNSGCGSHYLIRDNAVIWLERIAPNRHSDYAIRERKRLLRGESKQRDLWSQLGRGWSRIRKRWSRSRD